MNKKVKVRRPKTTRDDLLSRLNTPLVSTTVVKPKPRKERRSSFFFRIGVDTDEKKRREVLSKPKELPIANAEVVARSTIYKEELPEAMKPKVDKVREYLLKDIGPSVLAMQTAVDQFYEVLKDTTDSEVNPQLQRDIEKMLQEGVRHKLAEYVCQYLGLKKDKAVQLQDALKVRAPKTNVVMMPDISKPERPLRE